MMVIRLDSGAARNRLNAIAAKISRPADMLAESATRVERALRAHFSERDKRGNRLGGRRTHFWADIANSTAIGQVTDRQAVIEIGDRRFSQKLRGGTIRAKRPWKGSGLLLLTIPVHPIAHGRRASVLRLEQGLKLVFIGNAAGGVIAAYGEGQMQVVYACTPQVRQSPDPRALPPGDVLEREAVQGGEDYLRTEIQRPIPPGGPKA